MTSRRTCSSAQVDLVQRPLEVRERARLVHARVDEHDPVAGRERPRVAVRHAGPRQRQPQPPDAGQHALAAPDLALAGGGHRARTIRGLLTPTAWGSAAVRAVGPSGSRRRRASTVRGRRRARPARRADAGDARSEYAARSPATPLSQEDAWQRAVEFLFERLAVRWEIAGRRRPSARRSCSRASASRPPDERRWIRDTLREHLAEHFPDMEAP